MPYLFDLVILALLVLSAWRGAVKGLMLSLCGLAAVFVAFFAAQFISDRFCAPVGNILRPIVIQTVRGADAEPVPADPARGYTVDELLASIRDKGLFEGFDDFLAQGVANDALGPKSPLEALAGYLAKGVAKALLFGLTFIGILLVWFLVNHALDLAFKLPILAEVNLAGGLIIGLIKGGLIAVVLVWLGQMAGLVPNPPDTLILSLFSVEKLGELLNNLPV